MLHAVLRKVNIAWLTGPILDKELRVSSRRFRNYLLRFVYLALLTLFVAIVWTATAKQQYSAATQIARMAEAATAIVTTIVQFQFYAVQIIAVIMLSTAISDEIYNRTLGALMTTPITSLQIVLGKLFSKLTQLLLLLGISLPILAIIRVFGGIPWNYIIASLAITLTATLFAGSLSLLFSISPRRAYAIILKTLFVLGFFYLFIPVVIAVLFLELFFEGTVQQDTIIAWCAYISPIIAMTYISVGMLEQATGIIPFFIWPVHCLIFLLLTVGVLLIAIKRVRKIALRSAVGQIEWQRQRKKKSKPSAVKNNLTKWLPPETPLRPVSGSPVIWKELRSPLIQGGRLSSIIGLAVAIGTLLATYIINYRNGSLEENFAHVTYVSIFFAIGAIYCAVLSSTSITSEKESQAWPLLLSTAMTDSQILWGKAIGGFRRCLPVWLFLLSHLLLFTLIGYIHPLATLYMLLLVAWVIIYLTGSGLYFSSRFKRTTTAVVCNFALAVLLWLALPLVFGFIAEIFQDRCLRQKFFKLQRGIVKIL